MMAKSEYTSKTKELMEVSFQWFVLYFLQLFLWV